MWREKENKCIDWISVLIIIFLCLCAVFNTDTNHSVVQTYNLTTYKLCDYNDAQENDTIQWSSVDPSNTAPHPVSVEVPLLKEGMSYFFSGFYDGEQCKNGQHFKINVSHGQGLPKSLQDPAAQNQSPGPASGPQSGNDEDSVPDTIVPSNFDHPHADDTEEENPSGSVALSIYVTQGMVVPFFILLMRFYIFWLLFFTFSSYLINLIFFKRLVLSFSRQIGYIWVFV